MRLISSSSFASLVWLKFLLCCSTLCRGGNRLFSVFVSGTGGLSLVVVGVLVLQLIFLVGPNEVFIDTGKLDMWTCRLS